MSHSVYSSEEADKEVGGFFEEFSAAHEELKLLRSKVAKLTAEIRFARQKAMDAVTERNRLRAALKNIEEGTSLTFNDEKMLSVAGVSITFQRPLKGGKKIKVRRNSRTLTEASGPESDELMPKLMRNLRKKLRLPA